MNHVHSLMIMAYEEKYFTSESEIIIGITRIMHGYAWIVLRQEAVIRCVVVRRQYHTNAYDFDSSIPPSCGRSRKHRGTLKLISNSQTKRNQKSYV